MPAAPRNRRLARRHARYQARYQAWARGRNAERFAAWFLRVRGYRVLAERYKTPLGEIDLIVRRGGTLIFVEVKARATLSAGLEAITPRQQSRIKSAAEVFLAKRHYQGPCRFDAVVVTPGRFGVPRVVHRQNAWD